jgi:SOS response regulatory protein OraA/RecX
MVSKELADYIKERRAERFSDDKIRTVLLAAGYDKATVEEALASSQATVAQPAQSQSQSPQIQPLSQ